MIVPCKILSVGLLIDKYGHPFLYIYFPLSILHLYIIIVSIVICFLDFTEPFTYCFLLLLGSWLRLTLTYIIMIGKQFTGGSVCKCVQLSAHAQRKLAGPNIFVRYEEQ